MVRRCDTYGMAEGICKLMNQQWCLPLSLLRFNFCILHSCFGQCKGFSRLKVSYTQGLSKIDALDFISKHPSMASTIYLLLILCCEGIHLSFCFACFPKIVVSLGWINYKVINVFLKARGPSPKFLRTIKLWKYPKHHGNIYATSLPTIQRPLTIYTVHGVQAQIARPN